jgi:DNA-binding MarR family transcriptional regulator
MRRADKLLTHIELAKAIRLTSGGITGVIDRLEKARYVQRKGDRKDRRLKFIQPNKDKAEADIDPLFYLLQERMAELYSSYKDEELAVVADFITKAIQVLQEATDKLRNKAIKEKPIRFRSSYRI